MHITVLAGSPKGEKSLTCQYTNYLARMYPEDTFSCIQLAQNAGSYQKEPGKLQRVASIIEKSDLVLFAFPLYFLTVSSGYMQSLQLLVRQGHRFPALHGAIITTSIHFFDHTAVNYVGSVAESLGISVIGELTFKMNDLTSAESRKVLKKSFEHWKQVTARNLELGRRYPDYPKNSQSTSFDLPPTERLEGSEGTRLAVISACSSSEPSWSSSMTEHASRLIEDTTVISLSDLFFGPCLGCLQCGFDNHCVYEGKDGYTDMYRKTILPEDIIIFSLEAEGPYFFSLWQKYLERSFFLNHRPTLAGKQVIYLVTGSMRARQNAREILSGYTETMGGSLLGIISSDDTPPEAAATRLSSLLDYALVLTEGQLSLPKSFLGVGGMKIFRDEVYSDLKFVFQQDHRYYRRYGIYKDLPHRRPLRRFLISLGVLVTRIPPLRKVIRRELSTQMLSQAAKAAEEAD